MNTLAKKWMIKWTSFHVSWLIVSYLPWVGFIVVLYHVRYVSHVLAWGDVLVYRAETNNFWIEHCLTLYNKNTNKFCHINLHFHQIPSGSYFWVLCNCMKRKQNAYYTEHISLIKLTVYPLDTSNDNSLLSLTNIIMQPYIMHYNTWHTQ